MRLSSLASIAFVPVLVLLAPSSAHAASPSGSGLKRVAKGSGAVAFALPAPTPKDEPLPPLPPPPPSASPVTLAPPSPSASPPSPVPFADARGNPDVAAATTPEVKPTGLVLQFGAGVLAPASSFAPGSSTFGPGVAFDLRLGGYATPHFGVLVGFRGSFGHDSNICGDACDKGYSLQVPVMLQFAQNDRARGLYGEIGLGFATTYGGSGHGVTYELTSPIELKLGTGYRVAGANGARRSVTLDLNFGIDIGTVDHAKLTAGTATYDGAIDSASTHVVVACSLISHFSL